jgi:hypothetical protein
MRSIFYVILLTMVTLSSVCSQQRPETKALELAKRSHTLRGDKSAEFFIEEFLKKRGSEVKGLGWEVKEEGNQEYLVSFMYEIHSFEEGIGKRGYFFKVNPNDGSVRNVTHEYLRKMPPFEKPYKDEKGLVDDLLKQKF